MLNRGNKNSIGFFRGRHYTEYVDEVKQLKRENRLIEAEELLLALIDAVEQESLIKQWPAAPGYYNQLAIVYRKQLRYNDEIFILERYCNWKYNPPQLTESFRVRIGKVKEIMRRKGINPS